MTKKHFIALADAIREHNRFAQGGEMEPAFTDFHLDTLAEFCNLQNSGFNRERWLDYIAGKVGPNGGKHRKRKDDRHT
jgi:hypothetical protein